MQPEVNLADGVWRRADWVAGLVSAAIAGAVYFWTAAPNVTLLDSGEFIVAAQHFGVPHPTGYPLWTMLAWAFQLLPLGNAAWEVNLFSGLCGAFAAGLVAALFSSSARWVLGEGLARWRGLNFTVAVASALLFAFSFSVWSQAVIAEVYTLHVLLVGLFLVSLYAWLRSPERLGLLLLQFFLLALAFSNHQLVVAMAPLPLLAVLLVRRAIFWDLVLACALTVLAAYLGFAILSGEGPVLKTAIRFFYCVMAGFAVLVLLRRFQVEWRLVAYLPFVVLLGLMPYAYMPLASATNPPMNWAYTRTPEGFFFSFNRSQYGGSLSQQSLRSLGKLMGTGETGGAEAAAEQGPQTIRQPGLVARLQEWVGFFWWQLGRSFTPLGVLAYFLSIFVVFRLPDVSRRNWVYCMHVGFILAATSFVGSEVTSGSAIDNSGWWVQMPLQAHTNLFFSVIAGLGFVAAACWLFARVPRLAPLRYGLLALPLWPLFFNYDGCSQRGRWFGWQFGHDMLKDLPAESVVLGGTDPGRFVPTYMIFGESSQAPGVKRDPAFDRRDLYIITQNGVGEPLYRKYLADHYGPDRPQPRNVFERWLGRDSMYPVKPLVFPSEDEIDKEVAKEMQRAADRGEVDPSIPHSVVTRLIWEKNRDAHAFFVEESFPLEWSYGHAEPHGLVYKIHREPLAQIPAESVRRDFEFWDGYSARLLADQNFKKDYDAQRSFSKLRATGGNLYRHRKMDSEAERAYRQALALWQGNGESLSALSEMLWERGDFDGVLALFEAALKEDPNNTGLWAMYFSAEKRKEMQGEIAGLEKMLVENPGDAEAAGKLVELYAAVDETNSLGPFLEKSIEALANNSEFLSQAVLQSRASDLKKTELAAAQALVAAEPGEAQNYFLLALAKLRNGDTEGSLQAAREAVGRGGLVMREALSKSPDFAPLRDNPEFQKITGE